MTQEAAEILRAPPPPARQWIVVTQVKSNRVVYFTDDPDYTPAMEGDWYYCSPHEGDLPQGMTLRNCWSWRFNGGVFSHAPDKPRTSTQQALLDANRKALLAILREKIDAVRVPFLPSCEHGARARELKLQEAKAFLAAGKPGEQGAARKFPMLEAVAAARNLSLLEAAKLVEAKAGETDAVLLQTERFREQLSQAIASASTQAALLEIREWLLDRVYPELTANFRFTIENTEPIDLDAEVGVTHRGHEVARLRTQLREAVNSKRAHLQSGYFLNDEVRKEKARIAQAVLANGGELPAGMNCELLANYAKARGVPLKQAAELLLQSMAETAQVLVATEAERDELLAAIDAVRTLRDIRAVGERIAKLAEHARPSQEGAST